eukprot:3237661-Alexandrium_andersonii.AAC.1
MVDDGALAGEQQTSTSRIRFSLRRAAQSRENSFLSWPAGQVALAAVRPDCVPRQNRRCPCSPR